MLNNKNQIGEPDLLWDKSFETELVKGFPVLCVPSKNAITSDLKLNGVNRNGFRLMVFQHNKEHEVKHDIWELFPDEKYISNKADFKRLKSGNLNTFSAYESIVDNFDFTGYLAVYTSDREVKAVFKIVEGVIFEVYDTKKI